jgi:hypothetical protein
MLGKIFGWIFKGHRVPTQVGGTIVQVPGSVASSRTLWGALIAAAGLILTYTLAPAVGQTGPVDWGPVGQFVSALGALLAVLGLGGKLQVLVKILLAVLGQLTSGGK